jgi:hypothetical protein
MSDSGDLAAEGGADRPMPQPHLGRHLGVAMPSRAIRSRECRPAARRIVQRRETLSRAALAILVLAP